MRQDMLAYERNMKLIVSSPYKYENRAWIVQEGKLCISILAYKCQLLRSYCMQHASNQS